MAYLKYTLRPLQHILDLSSPSLNQSFTHATWPTQNVTLTQKSIQKRPGNTLDRELGSNTEVQSILRFQLSTGASHTIYLTPENIYKRVSSGTWNYLTEVYSTGSIASISGAVVTGTATGWKTGTGNPAEGDYFIVKTDLDNGSEPNAAWAEIKTVDTDTQITLVDNYKGATTTGEYYVRRLYSVPDNERWSHCIVNDKLCFTNGNVDVQYWSGTDFASALDSTHAKKARYCIEYANRLVLADIYLPDNGGYVRSPYTVKYSKEGDPTNWIDNTAGEADMLETEDVITGLGKTGRNLVVFKPDAFILGNRTGVSTSPISFSEERKGIGCPAPYSIVNVLGTAAFVGRTDFYILSGDTPIPIGEPVRAKFFSLVNPTELRKVSGFYNSLRNEVHWLMTGDDNKRHDFVWHFQEKEWEYFSYNQVVTCIGKGDI